MNRKERRAAPFSVFCPEIVNFVVRMERDVTIRPTVHFAHFGLWRFLLNSTIYTLPSR